jgi:hypothetical protein
MVSVAYQFVAPFKTIQEGEKQQLKEVLDPIEAWLDVVEMREDVTDYPTLISTIKLIIYEGRWSENFS